MKNVWIVGLGAIVASLAIGIGGGYEAVDARQRETAVREALGRAEEGERVAEAKAQAAEATAQAAEAKALASEQVVARLRAEERKRIAEARAQGATDSRAEEEARVADAKLRLVANPSLFLVASDIGYQDGGILDDYRQVTRMRVQNTSNFPVIDVSGEFDWTNDDGSKVGSIPFSLRGSITAGEIKPFTMDDGSLKNGTIVTSVTHVTARFTNVTIVETQ